MTEAARRKSSAPSTTTATTAASTSTAPTTASDGVDVESLQRVARDLAKPTKPARGRPATGTLTTSAGDGRPTARARSSSNAATASDGVDVESLQRVARELGKPAKPARGRPATGMLTTSADDGRTTAMDVITPVRDVPLELVSGRGHYERVIDAVRNAHTSVWIATANVKELMIEDGRARPGQRRSMKRTSYVSVLAILDELAARDVELRLLHAEIPSGPFRRELANHPRLVAGGLALRRCPRVHMKIVVVDGELMYLGSANWTGAGLGAKGSGRRNFELGIVTGDAQMLDQVQSLFDHVWRGAACEGCKLRAECPGPLAELGQGLETAGRAAGNAGKPRKRRGRRVQRARRK